MTYQSPVAPELVARVQALAKIEAEREAQEVEAKLAAEEEEKARLRREAEEERAEREAQRLAALQKLRRTADAPKVASPSKTPGSQMKLRYGWRTLFFSLSQPRPHKRIVGTKQTKFSSC